jgi:hypothetical protein
MENTLRPTSQVLMRWLINIENFEQKKKKRKTIRLKTSLKILQVMRLKENLRVLQKPKLYIQKTGKEKKQKIINL